MSVLQNKSTYANCINGQGCPGNAILPCPIQSFKTYGGEVSPCEVGACPCDSKPRLLNFNVRQLDSVHDPNNIHCVPATHVQNTVHVLNHSSSLLLLSIHSNQNNESIGDLPLNLDSPASTYSQRPVYMA